jgi:hypothetical protein
MNKCVLRWDLYRVWSHGKLMDNKEIKVTKYLMGSFPAALLSHEHTHTRNKTQKHVEGRSQFSLDRNRCIMVFLYAGHRS